MGKVTYLAPDGRSYIVEAETGLSIMRLATSNAVPGIVAECGGTLSCATCHVYVEPQWIKATGIPGETEAAMLSFAVNPQSNSRLSCQINYTEALDGLTVRIPEEQ